MNQELEPSLLVISAIAPNEPGFVKKITDVINQCNCNITESKMKSMGDKFSLVLMASGEWNAITKLEQILPSHAQSLGMATMLQRTKAVKCKDQHTPYRVKMTTNDRRGLSKQITQFFSNKHINIEELSCNTFDSQHTENQIAGDKLVLIKLTVNIPSSADINLLESEFGVFCQTENIEATLLPVNY